MPENLNTHVTWQGALRRSYDEHSADLLELTVSMQSASKQISISGNRRIGYREQGAGATILALHGVGSSSQSYTEQLSGLSQHYRVIAWDAPGYGGSDDSPQSSPTPADYADDAAQLMDALDINAAHIVGHSMGGLIATALVARHRARVNALVLSSCASGYARLDATTRDSQLQARAGLLAAHGAEGLARLRGPGNCAPQTAPEIVEQVIAIMARVRPNGYLAGAKLLGSGDVFNEIRSWQGTTPETLVIVGAHDKTTPPPESRRIAHCIPGALYRELALSAHACYFEQSEQFNALLHQHFAGAASRL